MVVAEVPPNTELPCPKPGLEPNTVGLLWLNIPPPVLAEACPKENKLGLLVLEGAPKTFPLEDGDEAPVWPKAGPELNPG